MNYFVIFQLFGQNYNFYYSISNKPNIMEFLFFFFKFRYKIKWRRCIQIIPMYEKTKSQNVLLDNCWDWWNKHVFAANLIGQKNLTQNLSWLVDFPICTNICQITFFFSLLRFFHFIKVKRKMIVWCLYNFVQTIEDENINYVNTLFFETLTFKWLAKLGYVQL